MKAGKHAGQLLQIYEDAQRLWHISPYKRISFARTKKKGHSYEWPRCLGGRRRRIMTVVISGAAKSNTNCVANFFRTQAEHQQCRCKQGQRVADRYRRGALDAEIAVINTAEHADSLARDRQRVPLAGGETESGQRAVFTGGAEQAAFLVKQADGQVF